MRTDSWEHVDIEPFDEYPVDRLTQYLYPTEWSEGYFLAILVMRYMEKLFQEHELEFTCWQPRCFFGTTFNEMYFDEDFYFSYGNEVADLLIYALHSLKWETLFFSLDRDDSRFEPLFTEDKDVPLDVMQAYLKSIGLNPGEIQIATNDTQFLNNTLLQYEAHGYVFIYWNDKVSRYGGLPADIKIWLAEHYGEKIYRIDQLMNRICYPLTNGWSNFITSEYQGKKYFAFDMGFNGESEMWFDSLDPNWVVCLFNLDAAMDDIFYILETVYSAAA